MFALAHMYRRPSFGRYAQTLHTVGGRDTALPLTREQQWEGTALHVVHSGISVVSSQSQLVFLRWKDGRWRAKRLALMTLS